MKSIDDKFSDKARTKIGPLRLREDIGDYVAERTRKLPTLVFYRSVSRSVGRSVDRFTRSDDSN